MMALPGTLAREAKPEESVGTDALTAIFVANIEMATPFTFHLAPEGVTSWTESDPRAGVSASADPDGEMVPEATRTATRNAPVMRRNTRAFTQSPGKVSELSVSRHRAPVANQGTDPRQK